MKPWVPLVCATLSITACKKSDAPLAAGSGSDIGSGSSMVAAATSDAAPTFVAKMAELTDKLCACADIDCASKVNDELVQYTVATAKPGGAPGTADDKAKIDQLQLKFAECTTRLQAAAPPSPPPKNEPPPTRTGGCDELHKKISAYASCDKITSEQRDAMFAATEPVEKANDGAKCAAQSATLVADAKKLLTCDIAAVGVKKAGPATPQCAALAKRLPGFAACDKLAFGWPELLRSEASVATDPNDDKACAAVIEKFTGYAKERFPGCKF